MGATTLIRGCMCTCDGYTAWDNYWVGIQMSVWMSYGYDYRD